MNFWFMERLGLAMLIGLFVGLEREIRDKPAGIRTMILISTGACLFSLVSLQSQGPEPTRIAAQIVSGVGFLGAGAILRDTKAVYGLTTAASIWMVAAVGMACGFGHYTFAIAGGVAILIVLTLLHYLTAAIDDANTVQKYRLSTSDPCFGFEDIDGLFDDRKLKVVHRSCYREGDCFIFGIRAKGHRSEHTKARESLLHLDHLVLMRS